MSDYLFNRFKGSLLIRDRVSLELALESYFKRLLFCSNSVLIISFFIGPS